MSRTLITSALLLLTAAPGWAQTDTTSPDTTRQQGAGAPVVVDGDTLFFIQLRLGPFGPDERAAAITQRLVRLASDPLLAEDTVRIVEEVGSTDVMVGGVVVLSITDADATAAGLSRADLAARRAADVRRALAPASVWSTVRAVLVGIVLTAFATAVLVVLWRAVDWGYPRIIARLEAWRATRIPALRIQRLELVSATRLTDFLVSAAGVIRIGLFVILLFYYVPLVFSFFPWTENVADRIFEYILAPLRQVGRGFVAYVPNFFFIAVIVLVTRYVLKFIRLFFNGIARGKLQFPNFYAEWAEPTYKIVRVLVLAFALIVIFPYLPGAGSEAFAGVSVFLGVLVSFGSASAIANVIAGVVITYMRPFKLGDRVKIADTVGDVVDRTLLVTRVRTVKNVDVSIPNALVLSSHIVNYSSSAKDRGLVLPTSVTIGYDAPWRKVHELLLAAAAATEQVLEDPKPFVLQTALDDFYVRYELNAYTDAAAAMNRIYSELHQNIQDTFNEAGVEIMSPHYGALRDGSATTVPEEHRPPGYQPPGFRVLTLRPQGGQGGQDRPGGQSW
jgi:small-conductance mechanosensitive channel